jgi:hypothetical protein
MTHHTLRKGFTLEAAPGGVGHLTDSRTGDVLVVPAADLPDLVSAIAEGKAPAVPYAPFFIATPDSTDSGFYELNIEDAPTGVNLPPSAARVPLDRASAPTLTNVSTAELELKVALAASARKAEEHQRPTDEHRAFELKLPDDELGESTIPAGASVEPAGPDLSQEDNLRQALEAHPTEQVSRADVQAILDEAAHGIAPEEPAPALRSRKPLVLTLVGVALLAAGVTATFALRPSGEPSPQPELPTPTVVIADASTPEPKPVVDSGPPVIKTPDEIDAGPVAAVAVIDAGTPPAPDAGANVEVEVVEGATWVNAELQARGRVKMGEVTASADGELAWTVADGQRVKAKQALGSVGGAPLSATSVGLAMLKQPGGAQVKRGAVLAEIIYFEAWARGLVKGVTPTTAWKCQVVAGAQRADCKVSVVAQRAGGSLVTVAIEPRWFDGATDAVLRLAPP